MDDDIDDLINDYIEQGDYGPSEDEIHDYMIAEEEEEAFGNTRNKETRTVNASKTPTMPNIMGANKIDDDPASSLTQRAESHETPRGKENLLQRVPANVEDTDAALVSDYRNQQRKGENNDMYSFERYTGRGQWRTSGHTQGQPLSPTMQAKHWKDKLSAVTVANGLRLGGATTNKSRQGPRSSESLLLQSSPQHSRCQTGGSNRRMVLSVKPSKGILSTPQAGIPAIPLTTGDGSRIYVRIREAGKDAKDSNNQTTSSSCCSLGVSMKELLRRSRETRRRLEHAKRRAVLALDSSSTPDTSEEMNQKDDAALYVDKHAPSSMSQLLSEERTNREVLRALREWDPYVFGRDPPSRPSNNLKSYNNNEKSNRDKDSPSQPSHDKRPDETSRVLLLSGKPGVGKTTMAKIAARHAGYRPLEINASDERSANVLTERVYRAMESTTLNVSSAAKHGKQKCNDDIGKPNCLILDEVDGADAKGAIAALVELIRAELPPPKSGAKGGAKRQQSAKYLRRPIIFICNHKYAPTLRPLLPYCRHFTVHPPTSSRLVSRLQAVLRDENLFVGSGSSLLHQLVVTTGGDIRNCLHTVQYAATAIHPNRNSRESSNDDRSSPSKKDISQALKKSLGTGSGSLKDERNDLAGTVTNIFRKSKQQKQVGGLFGNKTSKRFSSGSEDHTSVSRVLRCVEGFGDNTKTIDTLFLNLPRVSYIDPTMDRCAASHEWLSGADLYRSLQRDNVTPMEQYSLQRLHIPSSAAAIHLLCRVELKPDLIFSTRELSDAAYRLDANLALIHKFAEGIPATSNSARSPHLLSIETIPYGMWILSAGDGGSSLKRATSSIDVLTKRERVAFDTHVATLRALGLTYVAALDELDTAGRNGDSVGHSNFAPKLMRIEPPIDRILQYRDLKVPTGFSRSEIPPAMKELLAREVLIQGLRQRSTVVDGTPTVPCSSPPRNPEEKLEKQGVVATEASPPATRKLEDLAMAAPLPKRAKTSGTRAASNFLGIGAQKAKAAKAARRAALVGLDGSKKAKAAHSGSGLLLSQVVRMKYVKGFTEAVRTPCRLQDLE